MAHTEAEWSVLLIGGASGTGKSTVARALARQEGATWLQVDDLRLALERVQGPDGLSPAIRAMLSGEAWGMGPDIARGGLIEIAKLLAPAIEAVVENHVDQRDPIVIEGDAILPALIERPAMVDQRHAIRAAFIEEPDEDVLFRGLVTRARGGPRSIDEFRAEARAKHAYGRWLSAEARRLEIPVVVSRPWPTLGARILAAAALVGR